QRREPLDGGHLWFPRSERLLVHGHPPPVPRPASSGRTSRLSSCQGGSVTSMLSCCRDSLSTLYRSTRACRLDAMHLSGRGAPCRADPPFGGAERQYSDPGSFPFRNDSPRLDTPANRCDRGVVRDRSLGREVGS